MTRFLASLAVLLVAARLFTGVVYEDDEATVYLVLKHTPSWTITAGNPPERRVRDDFTVLDEDELSLAYENAYRRLMRWTPVLAGCCGLAAWGLRRRRL